MIATQARPRGVTLTLLDLDLLIESAQEKLIEDGIANPRVRLGHVPYAAAEHDGQLYVVCHEGVGWPVGPNDPLTIPIYGSDGDSRNIPLFPRWEVELDEREVRERMTAGEVDLADLVRTFGQRLEDNFAAWYRRLGGAR